MAAFDVVLLNWVDRVEGPETTDQVPLPVAGALAARVAALPLQTDWSAPAFDTVGLPFTVITTSSVRDGQGLLLIVQRSV